MWWSSTCSQSSGPSARQRGGLQDDDAVASGGQIELRHEQAVWGTVAKTLEAAYEYYTEEDAGGSDSAAADPFEQRVRDAATRIVEKALARFLTLTGAG